ncbi:hypothetical protein CRG98_011234 [Punica granatum]|nr:hypothetical protein CRG98_011234 [Punica granatum]
MGRSTRSGPSPTIVADPPVVLDPLSQSLLLLLRLRVHSPDLPLQVRRPLPHRRALLPGPAPSPPARPRLSMVRTLLLSFRPPLASPPTPPEAPPTSPPTATRLAQRSVKRAPSSRRR